MSKSRPSTRSRTRRVVGAVALSGLSVFATFSLAACTPDPVVITATATVPASATPGASPSAAASTPTAPTPTSAPVASAGPQDDPPGASAPFYANTLPDTSTASADAFLSPVNLRFGTHQGYDRIVIDLAGTGTPGWRAEYVDHPVGDPSGEPVVLAGGAYLRIAVSGVTYPTEPGASPYVGPADFSPASGVVVREVKVGGVFEGIVEVFVGVTSKEPFRVYSLADPARVVIDVQHP